MLKLVVLVAGLLIAGGTMAAEIPLTNADFEQPMLGKRIPGWSRTQHAGVGAYEVSTDTEHFAHGKHSIRMQRTTEQVYGLIMQHVEIKDFGGKHVQLRAMLKTADVGKEGWVMVMTFKNYDNILDQVRSKPVTGDTAWTDVVLKKIAPPNTNRVDVGFLLLDGGTGWADHVRLRTLDDDAASKDKAEALPNEKVKPAAPKPSVPAGDNKHG